MAKIWIVFVAVIAALDARSTDESSWRIVNGNEAAKGAYPWQVSLRVYDPNGNGVRHICGGSIIAAQWVLTASHCVQNDPNPSSYLVTVGEHDFTVDEGTEQHFNVLQVIMHEQFNAQYYINDVTLLLLDRPMSFNQYVSTIPLAQPSYVITGQELCATSGWGDLYSHGTPPTVLHELNMPLVRHSECEQAYQQIGPVTDVMICAGYMEGGRGVCQGDSGGPLVCQINGQFTLVGVTSWGVGCAEYGHPGIFARVSSFYNWIEQHTASVG